MKKQVQYTLFQFPEGFHCPNCYKNRCAGYYVGRYVFCETCVKEFLPEVVATMEREKDGLPIERPDPEKTAPMFPDEAHLFTKRRPVNRKVQGIALRRVPQGEPARRCETA